MSKTSHYKATTKRGFEAGELAGLLASHSPNADYKVVISLRGKVRELIITEDGSGREAVAGALHDRDAAACLPPVEVLPEHADRWLPRYESLGDEDPNGGQRHGGKLEATFHGTAATYPPGELTDEALNVWFGDPRLSNLDRRDGLK